MIAVIAAAAVCVVPPAYTPKPGDVAFMARQPATADLTLPGGYYVTTPQRKFWDVFQSLWRPEHAKDRDYVREAERTGLAWRLPVNTPVRVIATHLPNKKGDPFYPVHVEVLCGPLRGQTVYARSCNVDRVPVPTPKGILPDLTEPD